MKMRERESLSETHQHGKIRGAEPEIPKLFIPFLISKFNVSKREVSSLLTDKFSSSLTLLISYLQVTTLLQLPATTTIVSEHHLIHLCNSSNVAEWDCPRNPTFWFISSTLWSPFRFKLVLSTVLVLLTLPYFTSLLPHRNSSTRHIDRLNMGIVGQGHGWRRRFTLIIQVKAQHYRQYFKHSH